MCKANYVRTDQDSIEDIDIELFLKKCEQKILSIAHSFTDGKEAGIQLFRSTTTADFCLAIRTDSISLIYDIAITLNGTQNDSQEDVRMMTFTNVGMECRYVNGKGYATLSDTFINRHSGMTIALRFSADKLLKNKLQQYLDSKNLG